MRITDAEAASIHRVTDEMAGKQAEVTLFGSRADDLLRGR
jgi:hypothetical protein